MCDNVICTFLALEYSTKIFDLVLHCIMGADQVHISWALEEGGGRDCVGEVIGTLHAAEHGFG